jgi:Aminotransferase class-V
MTWEATGARLVRAPVESLWEHLGQLTRILSVSHVASPAGAVLPVAELFARAREAGLLAVVDGAHAPGHVPVDLGVLGADAYAGTCHKWLCSPKGAGFLWVRPELQERVEPLVVSWAGGLRSSRRATAGRGRAIPRRGSPCRPRSSSSASGAGTRCGRTATRSSSASSPSPACRRSRASSARCSRSGSRRAIRKSSSGVSTTSTGSRSRASTTTAGRCPDRVIEYIDHLHEHFRCPVMMQAGCYLPARGAPLQRRDHPQEPSSRNRFPGGEAWASASA